MSGSSTLWSALARGSRLNVWNTNPISLLRMRASSSSERADTFWPLSQYSPAVGVDRKSTRLNSSHSQISYAVFCLKKKKTQTMSARKGIRLNYSHTLTASALALHDCPRVQPSMSIIHTPCVSYAWDRPHPTPDEHL